MAILLVHNLEHFIYPVYPEVVPDWLTIIDNGVVSGVFSLFAGKAYAIFALLFGFTFYLQSDNQRRKGKDFGYRFLWRLVMLAIFATVNAAFFPAGDVLLLFVIVGLVLFLVRNLSSSVVLILSIVFLLQPVEWFHYVAGLVNPSHSLPDLKVGEMYAAVGESTASGSIGDFLWTNITLGQWASLMWAVGAGRLFQTAGLFLLGFYIGRKELFAESDKNFSFWVRTLIVAAISFAPLYAWKEMIMGSEDELVRQTAGTAFDMWQKLAFTLVLIASFVLLYHSEKFRSGVDSLRYYGRMSLTNYITQSVIGAIIYFPAGFSLASHCGYTVSLLIGLVTFYFQMRFSRWWLSTHRQGPLESLWHKWTWLGR